MRLASFAVLAMPLVLAAPASAFAAVPPGSSVHDDITAAAETVWSAGSMPALQQAVREPDYQESELDPQADKITRIDATAAYRPEHHCDRTPGTSDADAFNATAAYVAQQRAEAANHSAAEPKKAIAALGRALHALQDCYSHSNIVDLAEQQTPYTEAVLENGPAVPGLRLVAYEPGADDPERPEGDAYSHGEFAKDDADKNAEAKAELPDGRTKFEAARDLAKNATVTFLQRFLRERTAEEVAGLMDVKEEDQGLPDDANVPGLSLLAALLAVGSAAVAWRRR